MGSLESPCEGLPRSPDTFLLKELKEKINALGWARAGGGRTAYLGEASDWRGGDEGKLLEKVGGMYVS